MFQHDLALENLSTPPHNNLEDDSSVSTTASLDVPMNEAPILQFISATTQVIGLDNQGELVDTGGNFCMCNNLSVLVNVQ
jgi:hypothetical protein